MLNRNEAANFCALPRESREQVFGRAVAVEQHIIAAVVAAERKDRGQFFGEAALRFGRRRHRMKEPAILRRRHWQRLLVWRIIRPRSEEHTSELQSLMRISYAVFCLKKKKQNK